MLLGIAALIYAIGSAGTKFWHCWEERLEARYYRAIDA